MTAQLFELMRDARAHGSQVHDANLVATMLVGGVRELVTANVADFAAFASLITCRPLSEWNTEDTTSSS